MELYENTKLCSMLHLNTFKNSTLYGASTGRKRFKVSTRKLLLQIKGLRATFHSPFKGADDILYLNI
jgi:hypothetical protein